MILPAPVGTASLKILRWRVPSRGAGASWSRRGRFLGSQCRGAVVSVQGYWQRVLSHDWCPSRTPFAGCAGDGWRARRGCGWWRRGVGRARGLRSVPSAAVVTLVDVSGAGGLPWAGRTAEPTIEQRDLKLSRLAWEFQEPDQPPLLTCPNRLDLLTSLAHHVFL